MQFYLLLVLSGVISGSTVLAEPVVGFETYDCSGSTLFSYTATCEHKCSDVDSWGGYSVGMPSDVQCTLYSEYSCGGVGAFYEQPGCHTISAGVRSYDCVRTDC